MSPIQKISLVMTSAASMTAEQASVSPMGPARRHLLFAVVLLAACGSASARGTSPTAAPVVAPPSSSTSAAPVLDRLPPLEAAALVRLAGASGPIDPAATHDHGAVTLASTLPPDEQARFDAQIAAAVDAAEHFA